MKHDILAPWADPVPDAPYPMTVAQLATLPDDTWQYEIVEGRLVRMPGSGSKASRLAIRFAVRLSLFAEQHNLGDVSGADGEYDLTQPGEPTETALVPDVAFVRTGRLPALNTPEANKIPRLAPDLVVEIAPPSQYHPEMDAKARMYLDRGVRLAWIVWPGKEEVDVWQAGAATPTTLARSDTLDGLDVIPGFTCPVADLFNI